MPVGPQLCLVSGHLVDFEVLGLLSRLYQRHGDVIDVDPSSEPLLRIWFTQITVILCRSKEDLWPMIRCLMEHYADAICKSI